jgi:phenylacetate-CoA ligase
VTVGSWVRRTGFWTLDRARGGRVRRHYEDIRAAMERGGADPAVLRGLLEHATRTTPAYEPYAGCALPDFPVLDRAALKRDPARYRSREPGPGDIIERHTSGSSGSPLVVGQDAEKRRRAIADAIYFNELGGQRVGDRLLWMYAPRLVAKPRRQRFLQNFIAVDHVGLDERRMEAVIRTLRRGRVNGVLSIASTLAALARHLERTGQAPADLGLRVVISSGETLDPRTRQRIRDAFGCPVVDRYANEENGVLASSRPDDQVLGLNSASYHFEFLKLDSDEAERPGHLARVVLTDLHNRAMPMIRYDTGDLAVVSDPGGDGPVGLARIEGRRADVIHTPDGGQLSAPTVSTIMVTHVPDIEQYQLVQVGPASYRLTVVLGPASYSDDELAAGLREVLGPDAQIEVHTVQSIAQAPSGKRRVVFREWPADRPMPQP